MIRKSISIFPLYINPLFFLLWTLETTHNPQRTIYTFVCPSMASTAAASSSFTLIKSSSSSSSSYSTRSPSLIRLASTLRPPFRRLGFSGAAADASFSHHVLSKIHSFSSLNSKPIRGAASMAKKSVGDLTSADLKGKKVFVRADLNVPLDDNQNITDDTRIRSAVPTIKYLMSNGAKVILSSHLVIFLSGFCLIFSNTVLC